jgi:hypothetical protein
MCSLWHFKEVNQVLTVSDSDAMQCTVQELLQLSVPLLQELRIKPAVQQQAAERHLQCA